MENLTGTVIDRDLEELSIIIEDATHRKSEIYLAFWLKNKRETGLLTLPQVGTIIKLENVKCMTLIPSIIREIDLYIGDHTTIISPDSDDDVDNTDNNLNIDSMADAIYLNLCCDNHKLLLLLENHKFTEKHLEIYIRFPELFPQIVDTKPIKLSMFAILVQENVMRDLILFQNRLYYENKPFYLCTPTTVELIGSNASQLKEPLNAEDHILPYFGNNPSEGNERLIGVLTSHLGKYRLDDGQTSVVISITSMTNSSALPFCNCLVLILHYHVLSEIYPDGVAETVLVDLKDVRIIKKDINMASEVFVQQNVWNVLSIYEKPAIMKVDEVDQQNIQELTEYRFVIEAISALSKVRNRFGFEVWLKLRNFKEILQESQTEEIYKVTMPTYYLVLGEAYLSTVTCLDLEREYALLAPQKLSDCLYNSELNEHSSKFRGLKLVAPGAIFIPLSEPKDLHITTTVPSGAATVNIIVTLKAHYMNDTDPTTFCYEGPHKVGMLARKYQHRLAVDWGGQEISMFLKNWELKQTPEGLHPHANLLFTNVYFTGKFLRANEFSNVRVIGVKDVLKQYKTANVNVPYKQANDKFGIVKIQRLNINYHYYVSTKIYFKAWEGEINYAKKTLDFRFLCMENEGEVDKVRCSKYDLYFKIFDIPVEARGNIQKGLEKYKRDSNMKDFTLDDHLITLPFVRKWREYQYHKMERQLISLDVLVKKLPDGWMIEDVYGVNKP